MINGAVNGDWRPIHDYCEAEQLPCLFPTTDLPVDSDQDFYSLYFSRGVILEGEGVARYLLNAESERKKIVQLYNGADRLSKSAAEAFAAQLEKAGVVITSIDVDAGGGDVDSISAKGRPGSVAVLWLSHEALQSYQPWLEGKNGPEQIYLSTTLYGDRASSLSEGLTGMVFSPFCDPSQTGKKCLSRDYRQRGGEFLYRQLLLVGTCFYYLACGQEGLARTQPEPVSVRGGTYRATLTRILSAPAVRRWPCGY
ncbi:MAG: hypothetical protein DIZ77_05525 [endosymbiont of Seepiophila jonesi]|uniref:Leucine-binding protein domain-containing protein n=1 Tax=endosymbiont of Lamellibrachia luymesi TaxID=2200907 RepID=A0A370DUF7_9GAMM|nr:MAG: hypothetical protein DIZ79_13920 [endosymbiont of Lamellibrachia luymesi]RDH93651.1 MAG: hypothetical protein DIZ77_05525 [endosymbiont of Seepiophila jonesi]